MRLSFPRAVPLKNKPQKGVEVLDKIDFVMIWVDGADPEWVREKNSYLSPDERGDNSEIRYRSWDNLQYWFRGVEKFAPWVNRIHFVTWGHLPPWLNTDSPKLNIVNHRDYIPQQYLPTFNANTIELNLHRIKGLSEHFVYFNDDMFVTSPVKPEDFFRDGCPMDTYGLDCIYFAKKSAGFFNGNDIELINTHFDKNKIFKSRERKKWLSLKNGMTRVVKTRLLNVWPWFPGIYYNHLPTNFLKSTFEKVWELEGETLDLTCRDKFRTKSNCNQWLMKFWQLCEGAALPRNKKIGRCFHIKDNIYNEMLDSIETGRYKLICVNDTIGTRDFDLQKQQVIEAFEKLLPEKSGFEL